MKQQHQSFLRVIHEEVAARVDRTITERADWPCRKGCDDCCRNLASVPVITQAEWELVAAALDALPAEGAAQARQRIRESTGYSRPVVCPLLDRDTGACLIYEARPVACRTYGFYVERGDVLGCSRIESLAKDEPHIVWGNHVAVEDRVHQLGPAKELFHWPEPPTE